jgi:hypothetical protein
MIKNTNNSDPFACENNAPSSLDTTGARSTYGVISNLIKKRENVLKGGINCIPFPFERFRNEIPGIEQGQYVIVSANQKVCKTQWANYVYLYHVLDYCFEHQDQCSCHIIYFALEESIQRIIERYMSHLLYELDGLRFAPSDLRSTHKEYPIPEEVLDLLNSDKYQERLRFFEKCVQFDTENTNPTGILRVCEEYAKSVGVYRSHKVSSKSNFAKEIEVFDSYKQNDPNHYKIVIIDHIGLVDKEQGFKTKDAIDKLSEYFVKYLRNRYNYTCVAIQQQASDTEGLEAQKQKKMVPSAAGLSDSKYTAKDANLVLGLFDPSKFGLPMWLGYKIQDTDGSGLLTYGRFLYVIANRDGEMGGVCPMFFDGAVCNFEELPRPDDVNAISSYYNKAKDMKSYRQSRKLSSLILSFFKR